MIRRFQSSALLKLKSAYVKNPELKRLVDELKSVVKTRPTTMKETMAWMKNEQVQILSAKLEKELVKEELSIMDIASELRNRVN